ncbi:MAG TPA: glycine dehydrogenase (aminomethyl-transferring), partial [Jatrophihabitantaceae bacterium]|nr:glycine dehydrogenase (aminomethyl-transferring) [Jatrophihabitantaceae bacterium]
MNPSDLAGLERDHPFAGRHIGVSDPEAQQRMLAVVGYSSMDQLIGDAVPASIREKLTLAIPAAGTEAEVAAELVELASSNQVLTSMIGLGYYDTVTPAVIRRNVLENPSWYTAYTPYQPEISQGRLEALLNFQTMIEDLTGLPVAGASLLDEATAAAEAMALSHRAGSGTAFVVDADVLPQTLDVLRTRATPLGLELIVHDLATPLPDAEIFGVLVQYPGASGTVGELAPIVAAAHARG